MAGLEEWSSRHRSARGDGGQNSAYGVTATLRLLISGIAASFLVAGTAAQDLSIREYKPESTLVVPAHPTPRAKYPVVDVHSHHRDLTPDSWTRIVSEMDALNLQVLVNLSGGSGETLPE